MIYFATSNPGKVKEAQEILKEFEVEQKDVGYEELRADSTEEVVRARIAEVFEKVGAPVFIEDSGLFIDSLDGFPGTYSSYVFKRLGSEGILKLMDKQDRRSAKFISSVAYQEPDSEVFVTSGSVSGNISFEMRGQGGFGYDPIFIPDGYDLTFAELGEEKNRISHRWQALKNLKNHLKKRPA